MTLVMVSMNHRLADFDDVFKHTCLATILVTVLIWHSSPPFVTPCLFMAPTVCTQSNVCQLSLSGGCSAHIATYTYAHTHPRTASQYHGLALADTCAGCARVVWGATGNFAPVSSPHPMIRRV
eukprot:Blabericola_migrator_1__3533@NODE_204_length_11434_cov_295_698249_g175_i0_p11_GENE_NODE_204_length_11434_cov_295_698249_g175_i0NODE_204_length_11434_cov_295_698249_g175_i0_p11_ORF_typecomplete_len123_score8_56_NODE_204_length_11434_cov_295_698249_g175_i0406774